MSSSKSAAIVPCGFSSFMRRLHRSSTAQKDTTGRVSMDQCMMTSASVKDFATFDGCETLLRGSSLTTVMSHGCKIFRNSQGSLETYAMSEQVRRLSFFLSHNWVVARFDKFICLAIRFNWTPSIAIACIWMVPAGFANRLSGTPLLVDVYGNTIGLWARLTTIPVFLISLFCLRDALRLLGFPGKAVFLDKTCIHQQDKEVMRQGIDKLGAFLGSSDRMFTMYTDVYLKKLWTIYEVACFLTLGHVSCLEIMPVFRAKLLFVMPMLCYVYSVGTIVEGVPGLSTYGQLILFGCFGFVSLGIYSYKTRSWYLHLRSTQQDLKQFDVKDCSCACESDRPLVYQNIAKLMRSTRLVSERAEEATALDAFNELVRREFWCSFAVTVDRLSARYRVYVAIGVLIGGPYLMDHIVFLDFRAALVITLYILLWVFAGFVLVLWAVEVLADALARIGGWRAVPLVVSSPLPVIVLALLFEVVIDLGRSWAQESDVGVAVFSLAIPVSGLCSRVAIQWRLNRLGDAAGTGGSRPSLVGVSRNDEGVPHGAGQGGLSEAAPGESKKPEIDLDDQATAWDRMLHSDTLICELA